MSTNTQTTDEDELRTWAKEPNNSIPAVMARWAVSEIDRLRKANADLTAACRLAKDALGDGFFREGGGWDVCQECGRDDYVGHRGNCLRKKAIEAITKECGQ